MVSSLIRGRVLNFWSSSSWWKGMCLLESKEDDPSNWFVDDIRKKVGSSLHAFFFADLWIENIPLKIKFPRFLLFLIIERTVGEI